ncbi:STAS domain-containing protein [Actinomadura kijaniata]|uniref:STAS domain-containing protein n=1 Tax=Actinomadura kijaniata TaxID=46161 RepID=UPI003F1CF818
MTSFDVTDRPWHEHLVLTVTGEVDLDTAPALRTALHGAIAAAPAGIIVDVRGLTFIDASGLNALAVAANRSAHLPDRLKLAAPPPRLNALLEVTGLSDHLPVHPTYPLLPV